ncbi:hypothetical protein MCAMS1_00502 [biofilm metagenome]
MGISKVINQVNFLMKNQSIIAVSSAFTTALIIFLLILPLCYEIDLTGIGKKMGINGLVSHSNFIADKTASNKAAQPMAPVLDASSAIQEPRQSAHVLTVPPHNNLTFRFYMERDYDLTYFWATDGKPLYCELRGEKPTATENKINVFGKLTEHKAKGFFISPFTGNYSLFWENKTEKPITVRLTAKGVFKSLS